MSQKSLGNPTIVVNNIAISLVPDSFVSKLGRGEVEVRHASTGNGGETIHTEKTETKVGCMSWEMYNTPETEALVEQWKANTAGNVVQAYEKGVTTKVLPGASMVNDPDFEGKADGKVKIEFKGDPIPVTTA